VWGLFNSFSVGSIEIANDWKPIFEEYSMTKKELYEAMGGRISMSSIGEYSDEYQILGKYGMVSWMGDYWDVWITGIHHGIELSSRRVKHLCERIKPLAKSIDTGFTGEATAEVLGNEEAYQIAVILGARKRRVDTPETLAKTRANLSKAREVA